MQLISANGSNFGLALRACFTPLVEAGPTAPDVLYVRGVPESLIGTSARKIGKNVNRTGKLGNSTLPEMRK
jgi:hypothetical protein